MKTHSSELTHCLIWRNFYRRHPISGYLQLAAAAAVYKHRKEISMHQNLSNLMWEKAHVVRISHEAIQACKLDTNRAVIVSTWKKSLIVSMAQRDHYVAGKAILQLRGTKP